VSSVKNYPLYCQGLLEDIISFGSTPSTVGDAPTTGGFGYTQDNLGGTTTSVICCCSRYKRNLSVCMSRGCGTHHNGKRVDFEKEGTLLIIKGPNMDAILLLDSLEIWWASWEPFETWGKKLTLATSLNTMEVMEPHMKDVEAHFA
jgi:hypothetical protein